MKPALSLSLLVICLAAPLSAQAKYAVSPVIATNNEGTSANAFPFTSTVQRRYMQVHSDLPNGAVRISAIGFRITATTIKPAGYRTLDMEMFMGRSRTWNTCSFYFDQNYLAPKTKVIKRKTFNFGPGIGASPGPSPFVTALELKLDAPYVRIPTFSVAWEIHMHSNVSGGSIGTIDADKANIVLGADSPYGTGCTATGRTAPVRHTVEIADIAGTLLLMFSASQCPANAPGILVLGTKKLDLKIPGLCTNLYTDLFLVTPIGIANANGDLNRDGTRWYYNAAGGAWLLPSIGAVTLYSQIMVFDAGQSGIKLAGSNGAMLTLPTSNTAKSVPVTRLFNNSGGVTEKMSALFTTSSVGYCLPTRFTYL
ncbi:MAG: hypothetical protein CMJ85_11575 [Planctomycetes bacterium]|jgi:hypothetical protein|nr:hypothetical protein [Planctomycetota bacterium]